MTTKRIPDDLNASVATGAKQHGKTGRSFNQGAMAEKANNAAHRADFHNMADERYAELVASGKTMPWRKMCCYLETRAFGKSLACRAAKKSTS